MKNGRAVAGRMAAPRTIVLDTAALLAGLGPGATTDHATRFWTARSARAEIRRGGATGRSAERMDAAGLDAREPTPESRARVEAEARASGDLSRLSPPDLDVLAVAQDAARDGSVALWSDDLAVLNVAARLGFATASVVGKTLRTVDTWYIRCTGCGRYTTEAAPGDTCGVCGHPMKRTRRPPARR